MKAQPARTSYTISHAQLGREDEAMMKRGSQRGKLMKRGPSWILHYSQYVMDEGQLRYLPTTKALGPWKGQGRLTKQEARTEADKIIARTNAISAVPRMRATLQQFIDTCFEPQHIAALRTKGGKAHYRTILRSHILPAFGEVKLHELTPQKVQILLSSKSETLSVGTVRHIRNVLSAIFKRAKFLGYWRGELPVDGVKCYGAEPKVQRALTALQIDMIVANLPERYRPLVRLLEATGLRISEALGLTWGRVNLTEEPMVVGEALVLKNSVYIDRSYRDGAWGPTKSAKSRRIVPLTSAGYVALQEMRERDPEAGADDPVFRARSGNPWSAHNFSTRYFKPACVAAGLAWAHVHCLRRTAASIPGMDPLVIQKVLGHADPKMTKHYQDPDLERARTQMEVVH